ncbi:MAG: phosphomannomutase/phosphoglucomutase, partial [Candidatus Andersenbacteria bacterium]|nr:phosphomannomutase/phosphoglucomutase [Candidatus Andersenbacteria bacterium]
MTALNRGMFRMYDIRGIVDADITPEIAELIGKAWGTYLMRKGVSKAVLGRDSRETSPEYAACVSKGLQSTGVSVTDIGMVISPMEYFAERHFDANGGVMITASHNPAEYNGFKLNYNKSSVYGDVLQEVADMIEKADFDEAEGLGGYEDKSTELEEAYFAMLKEKIQLEKPWKVVVDCGNGTAGPFAPRALRGWGCEVTELYCDVDPSFPNHQPDPVKEQYLQDLIAKVKEEDADLGIGYDGDGDRIGVVDRNGNIAWGDDLMILYFEEVLKNYPGMRSIIEVKCSQALVDMVEKFGGKPEFYKTGHSLIKARMKEIDAKFTGEMSGHMFFADEFYGYDDAIYATGRLLRALERKGVDLADAFEGVPEYHSTPEVRVETTDEAKFPLVEKIVKHFKEETDFDVEDVDGARVLFGDGWVLVRASNT